MTQDILSLSVADLLQAFRLKKVSPVEAARASWQQAQKYNPVFNAFVSFNDEASFIKSAQASEARWMNGTQTGPFDGLPVTIKDGANVKGFVTSEGSLTMPSTPQTGDSPYVARLREAGAVFLGKTTLPEFGHKGITKSPLTGVTRNPWDTGKTSGGSSGGAAVAAAVRMGFLHHGSDGGGSIRIPANFCGVFGHKPSAGLVPAWPPTLFSTIAVSGPITRTVEDAALMLDIITRPDINDWHSVPYQDRAFAGKLGTTPKNLRIAYARTINNVPVDADVARVVEAAVKKMDGLIGRVENITLNMPSLLDTFNKQWMAIAAWILKKTPEDQRGKMDTTLLKWARHGAQLDLQGYLDAELDRMMIGHQMQKLMGDYDLLVLPVTPMPAFGADVETPETWDLSLGENWTPFTLPANLCKLPAASLPCGLTSKGLPVGLQIVSGYLKDALVLQTASVLERELAFKDWLARTLAGDPLLKKAV